MKKQNESLKLKLIERANKQLHESNNLGAKKKSSKLWIFLGLVLMASSLLYKFFQNKLIVFV